jgi:hypothetical protein
MNVILPPQFTTVFELFATCNSNMAIVQTYEVGTTLSQLACYLRSLLGAALYYQTKL